MGLTTVGARTLVLGVGGSVPALRTLRTSCTSRVALPSRCGNAPSLWDDFPRRMAARELVCMVAVQPAVTTRATCGAT